MSILFKNGTVVDYANKLEKKLDILVEGDKIAKIAENIDKLKGFNVKLDWERYYPYGKVFKTIFYNNSFK